MLPVRPASCDRKRMELPRARKWFASVLLVTGLSVWTTAGADSDAGPLERDTETVEFGGVTYEVPSPWKGSRIRTYADPSALVPLPSHLTGQRGIYVTKATRDAFVAMASQARKAGIRLEVDSGFRSYRYQKQILERVLARGVAFDQAVQRIAPPGYSEHATGEAVDLVPSTGSFGDTAEYAWLLENAANYCFRETYPKSTTGGYAWEPWHWRFEECRDQVDEPDREGPDAPPKPTQESQLEMALGPT